MQPHEQRDLSSHCCVYSLVRLLGCIGLWPLKTCSHLPTPRDTEIWPVQVKTLCQLLTGRMGSTAILPDKGPVIIRTMFRLERVKFQCQYV